MSLVCESGFFAIGGEVGGSRVPGSFLVLVRGWRKGFGLGTGSEVSEVIR